MKAVETKNPSSTAMLERGYLKTGNAKYNILSHMLDGNTLTNLQAYELGSTCLNTVVSEVCKQYNLEIPRKWIKVPTRFGNEVSVKQYWTSDLDNEKLGYILEPVI
jgi:hypothetical protein